MTSTIQPSQRPIRAAAAGPAGTPVVIGVDLGTTSAKVIAVDADLRTWAGTANAYGLQSPQPGWAEQDPDEVVAAARHGLTDVVAAARAHGAVIAGVSLSAAMHSVLAVDEHGTPLTPALTYADSRAADLAAAHRGTPEGMALYHRTGVPHHPMAPLFKMAWFAEHEPSLVRRVARWVSLKEYLLSQLGAPPAVDHSIASGTGMFDLHRRQWDPAALALAGATEAQLSPLVAATTVLQCDGLDAPLVVGAGDGALSNLGAGALRPGVGALSIGTSGAVRVVSGQPATDERARLFCAALDDAHWVVGGAISNGGLVLRWLRDKLFAGAARMEYDELTALAEAVAPGADGVLVLPYLTAERAPSWDGRLGGAVLNIDLRHGTGHVVRAALEGVAFQLRMVADAMTDVGCAIDRLHASGGFTASRLWVQILADVLGREIVVPLESEGSSLGAVMLGLVALGLVEDLDAVSTRVPFGASVSPQPANAAAYDDAYGQFRDAAEAR
jgi:gluconokinase